MVVDPVWLPAGGRPRLRAALPSYRSSERCSRRHRRVGGRGSNALGPFWTIEEVTVDGDFGTVDGERRRLQPGGVHVLSLFTGSAFAEEQDIGDDRRALAL